MASGDVLERGDLLIDGDRIAGVGEHRRPGAEVIDGRELIAMPGMVDTHRHMWAAIRAVALATATWPTTSARSSSPTARRSRRRTRTPASASASRRPARSDHGDARRGSTTSRPPAHARAALQAMQESGLRGRFSYGPSSDPIGRQLLPRRGPSRSTSTTSSAYGTSSSAAPGRIGPRDRPVVGTSTRRSTSGSRSSPGHARTACRSRCTRMMIPHDLANGRAISIYHESGRPRPGHAARPLHPGERRRDPLARGDPHAGVDLDPRRPCAAAWACRRRSRW